ncbi:MAG: hypothetical protein IJP68_06430 [Selenomonadaceae bacterium]|nr:hypothetical protein [Selenomonadaceae bacterium]
MDKRTLIEKIKAMAAARTCCPELKRAVHSYLVALGKPSEKIAAKNLIAEIEEDLVTIDELLTFARSAHAIQILGKEGARKLLAHANELKASGAKYCDCPACTPAAEILQYKELLLSAKKDSLDKQALIEKLKKIVASPSCCDELEEMIKKYFAALGTPKERLAAEYLIDELKADVVPIELLVINAHSNSAVEYFGVEGAKKFAAHADQLKASGAKYCNCLACTLGLEVLEHKDILLSK